MAGKVARNRFSRWLIPYYIRFYRIDTDEAEKPWREYRTLSEFFSRRLRQGARTATAACGLVLSPVDGLVLEAGRLHAGCAVQAKGVTYSIAGLLREGAEEFADGDYITLYLSPSDYHRIHIPLASQLRRAFRVPGSFFPVNRRGVSAIPGLYSKNERVVALLQATGGLYAMVSVGAAVVGGIQWRAQASYFQGEEFGWFEFGSTVVLLFAPEMVELTVRKGDSVKALAPIGKEK